MMKKRAKGKNTAKKAKKKQSTQESKKELNPAKVREEIAAMVEAEAGELAGAVIEEGKKGQLPTVKYLFEMAHIFPEKPGDNEGSANEDSLAKTLLDRLNIPDDPVVHDQYERGEDVVVIHSSQTAGSDTKTEDEKKDETVVGVE